MVYLPLKQHIFIFIGIDKCSPSDSHPFGTCCGECIAQLELVRCAPCHRRRGSALRMPKSSTEWVCCTQRTTTPFCAVSCHAMSLWTACTRMPLTPVPCARAVACARVESRHRPISSHGGPKFERRPKRTLRCTLIGRRPPVDLSSRLAS